MNSPSVDLQTKKTNLFLVLAGIFIASAIVAELVGVKIFSVEKTLGIDPAQIRLFGGFVLDFNLTAGVVLWPIVFLTSDIINEYFGKAGVKKISYLTAALISVAFVAIYIITILPPADFWLDVNGTDSEGKPFNIDYAFKVIFQQGLGIILGSLIAFLVGQLLDVFIFQKLRKLTGSKMIWLRATGSTLVSQLIDSYVVLFIAFYLLSPSSTQWPIAQIMAVGTINYIYKFFVAVILTPLLYVGHHIIDRYLGKENAEHLTTEAAASSKSLI